MVALGFAVHIHADEHALVRARLCVKHPVVGGAEMWGGSRRGDACCRSAHRGHPVNAGLVRSQGRGQAAAFQLFKDDRLAIGRETRAGIMAGLRRCLFGRTAACAYGVDVTKAFIGPMDISDGFAVARPSGIGLHTGIGRGQASCSAPCCGLEP